MLKIILFIILITFTNQLTYTISLQNQKTGEIIKTESSIEIDLKNPDDSFSNSDEIVNNLKTAEKGFYTLIFKNEKKEHILKSSILLKENEKIIKDLTFNLILNDQNRPIAVNTLKKYIKVNKNSNYIKIEKPQISKEDISFENSNSNLNERPSFKPNAGGDFKNEGEIKPVKEKTFFQKWFWWIIIGGFLIMQLMKVDKNKIQEAYAQAEQQKNARK